MKKLLIVLAAVSAVILTFACQQKQTKAPGSGQPEAAADAASAVIDSATAARIREELTASMMKYAQMWNDKDINAISDVWAHDPDVVFIPTATHDRIVGFEAVRKFYQDNFDSMDKIDFKIKDLIIKVTPDGNTAVITYYVENDYTDKATGKPGKKTPRVCVVKTKVNGEWKMIFADSTVSIADITKANPAPAKKAATKK
jgi:ketosteroid isomerase-like protein